MIWKSKGNSAYMNMFTIMNFLYRLTLSTYHPGKKMAEEPWDPSSSSPISPTCTTLIWTGTSRWTAPFSFLLKFNQDATESQAWVVLSQEKNLWSQRYTYEENLLSTRWGEKVRNDFDPMSTDPWVQCSWHTLYDYFLTIDFSLSNIHIIMLACIYSSQSNNLWNG